MLFLLNFFEVLRYWEDVPFSISYSLYCNKIAYVHEPLYHYDKTNETSLTATEGDNIDFNICRVKSVGMIDYHLSLSGKKNIFEKDLIWLKHWIKDAFVRYEKNKERIETQSIRSIFMQRAILKPYFQFSTADDSIFTNTSSFVK